MKELYFCPDFWRIDPMVSTTMAGKTTVKGFDGQDTETWQLADWGYNWSTIRTELELAPGEECRLSFWLNGGENDRFDEVCELEVFGENKWEERRIFKLNRGFTPPVKYKNGWYLFSVTFTAPEEKTVLRFNCMGAVTTIAPAEAPEAYDSLTSDPEDYDKPQRHNLVFPEGWTKSENDTAVRLVVRGSEVAITHKQLKTAAKVAGGILLGAAALRILRGKRSNSEH